MNAQAMFKNGGVKVFDGPIGEGGTHVGYVWVEPVAGDPNGQKQYWVLKKLLQAGMFDLQAWDVDPPKERDEWVTRVPALWQEVDASFYVVAQSTVIAHSRGALDKLHAPVALPPPPRHDLADRLRNWVRQQAILGPTEIGAGTSPSKAPVKAPGAGKPRKASEPDGPKWQVIVPFAEMKQGVADPNVLVGWCGGTLLNATPPYFEGEEQFLLMEGYQGAGTPNLRHRIRQSDPPMGFQSLNGFINDNWQVGFRHERTACSYYVGDHAPPLFFR